ncbi:galactofuranosylgalactofuranosylrhamnosyl-N-acetylglucosaminyl-diphospho-decaprenol beta-1,5/1,6-galactofuranosyltransferase [Cellulosimicrobium aquatile]|uniref:Glycosyltransferase family 2 protein n=2 Tax=Cellulosimicrobium TaxID=157920 RepID=A0A4Y8R0F1_9MICO|nr:MULTISPECIES: glycosyltransferase [Cellulosimicrobium]TGA72974.1 glycosyltransferase family 2 protein [Cellulosimicrobium terreum]UTT58400.1 glycosyltransferase [Cellulosimicrobium cellulans]MCM3534322.1 glycosyltransferase [Cellulosimicrobium funkei]MDQ8042450.1 glycosyltransferase [Cellulosimicrobium sp. XJ-DQ-B-000]NMF28379.1 glycosyltransferase family 2 protein [Cellulosimicrobium aquatile]
MSTQTQQTATDEAAESVEHRIVQRVILPIEADSDSLPLYVEAGEMRARQIQTDLESLWSRSQQSDSFSRSSEQVRSQDINGRFSMLVRPGRRISFATYFNAFPASYWRRWTVVESVRLTVATSGPGSVTVYRSNARGVQQRVTSVQVSGDTTTDLDLSLAQFGDGGWYWFDLIGGAEPLLLSHAEWSVDAAARREGTTSVGITTFNRADYCLETIRTVAESPEVREILDELIVVDQGTQRVRDQDGFPELEAEMGPQLKLVEQGNIGGSGGFSRGMYETLQSGKSDYVILLDDDIVLEPESILRLVSFADFTRKPTIVGGHMFDMYNRSVLHTFGEVVEPWRIQPGLPHADMENGHDFGSSGLRATPWLHRRVDVDYNGWWMCLIPVEVIREIGLSLPVFIKWDDAEYGLRARAHGYPTVSLPGAAVWHVSWADKDDLVGWQAYFHERNRLITTLLYSLYERGGRVLRESTYMDVKHLISMQYFSERGRLMAMRDVLAGPEQLHGIIGSKLPEIRGMVQDFSDARYAPDADAFPAPAPSKPRNKGRGVQMPSRVALVPWAAKTMVRQIVVPVDDERADRPQTLVSHQDARWWRLSQYDSAIVSNAEGTGASWHRRDPRVVREMLTEGLKLHAQLFARWAELRSAYRDALPVITSVEEWERTFAANPPAQR